MRELFRLFAQIALLRRGPQDLPASRLLLGLTVGLYLGVNLLVVSLLPSIQDGAAQVLVHALFTLVWYVALLQLLGRSERFLQTATAVFGLQALISPLLITSGWLALRVREDALWQLPVEVGALLLIVWVVAASSQIVRAALEWSSAASVALVILQIFTGQLLYLALFPADGA